MGSARCRPDEIVIDRHALSLDGGCVLRGLCDEVRIRSDLQAGQIWYVRIADSPALRKLDLTGCPGSFDLEMDGSVRCERVLLPEEGASLLLSVTGDFFPCRIEGWIDECQLIMPAGHELQGFYRVQKCSGMALLGTSVLKACKGIEGYLRVDQSGRGLQFKQLRPGARPEDIFWQLLDGRGDSITSRLALLSTGEFSRLCLEGSPEMLERRQELLRERCDRDEICRQLLRLFRQGYNPKAVWALRCMVQQTSRRSRSPESLRPALLRARAEWSDARIALYWHSPLSSLDLRLLMLCSCTGLTRRCFRQLNQQMNPDKLSGLIAFSASLHRGHPWCRTIDRAILALLDELLERHEGDWSDNRQDALDRRGRRDLRKALHHAARIDREGLRERLFHFASAVLSANASIRAGLELCEAGLAQGRDLVVSGLEQASDPDPDLKARAMRCLLAPQ